MIVLSFLSDCGTKIVDGGADFKRIDIKRPSAAHYFKLTLLVWVA